MSSTNFNFENCDVKTVCEIEIFDVKQFKSKISIQVKNYINYELIKNKMNVYKKPLLIKDNKKEPKNTVYNQRHIRDLIFEYVGENPYKKYDAKLFIQDNIYNDYKSIKNLDIIGLHKIINNDWYKQSYLNEYNNCNANYYLNDYDFENKKHKSHICHFMKESKRITVKQLRNISKEIFNTKNSKMKKQELLNLLLDRNNTKNLWWYYEKGIELKSMNIRMIIRRERRGFRCIDKDDNTKQRFLYLHGECDDLDIELCLVEGEL